MNHKLLKNYSCITIQQIAYLSLLMAHSVISSSTTNGQVVDATTTVFGRVLVGASAGQGVVGSSPVPTGELSPTSISLADANVDGDGRVIRSGSVTATAVAPSISSGSVSIFNRGFKPPLPLSGGFATASGSIIYEFEVAETMSLFVEAVSQQDAFPAFGDVGPTIRILNPFDRLLIDEQADVGAAVSYSFPLDPGGYKLEIIGARVAAAFAELSDVDSQHSTVANWGLGGLPGTLDDPIFPTTVGADGFGFEVITSDTVQFYDPEYATGYDFSTDDTPFASVLIPNALPGGDASFEVVIGGTAYALTAGEPFDFTSISVGGVLSFGIRGIDLSEELDPADPMAFVTGLSFVQSGLLSSFLMSPVTAFTPPLTGDFDSDGDVDGGDFLAWQQDPSIGSLIDWQNDYFGSNSLAAGSVALPEPHTLMLVALGMLCYSVRHRIA